MNNKLSIERIKQYATDPRMCNISDELRSGMMELLAYREAESKQKPVGFGIMLVNGGVIQTHEVYITEQSAINAIDNILSAKPRAHETFIPVPLYTSPVLSQPVPDEISELCKKLESFSKQEHMQNNKEPVKHAMKLAADMLRRTSPVLGQTPINTELLEALKGLIAHASGGTKQCGHDFECICPFDAARAAIAKTTGESE